MGYAAHRPVRLIASDLDGTLLNAQHEVGPLTDKALREAMARGILFTIATGKTFPSTEWLLRQYDIRIPIICSNGALVQAPDGTILHQVSIPSEYAIEAIQMARALGLTPVIYAGVELVTTDFNASVKELMAFHEPIPRVIPDIEAALEDGLQVDKLMLMNRDDLPGVAAFQPTLERAFAGRAGVIRSGLASLVEMMPLGVTKGTALAFILDYLGIPADAVIAFGDNCNDLDMIRRAGIGVAMAHAPEDVRSGADYVTGSNDEDGVGQALTRFVLSPNPISAASGQTPP
jgi:Cof subfamily protein (haloacid dehalogenase superfamily)